MWVGRQAHVVAQSVAAVGFEELLNAADPHITLTPRRKQEQRPERGDGGGRGRKRTSKTPAEGPATRLLAIPRAIAEATSISMRVELICAGRSTTPKATQAAAPRPPDMHRTIGRVIRWRVLRVGV